MLLYKPDNTHFSNSCSHLWNLSPRLELQTLVGYVSTWVCTCVCVDVCVYIYIYIYIYIFVGYECVCIRLMHRLHSYLQNKFLQVLMVFYVYWTVHHLDSWIKIDQLMSLALFFAQHVSMLVHSSWGACDCVWVYCSGSMCGGVKVWFGWGGVVSLCRLKHWRWMY